MTAPIELPEAYHGLFKPARYKAFYGGRGSAKSHSFATALLILGGQRKIRILCGREIQNSIRESVKQLLDDKIRTLGMGSFYHSLQSEIRGLNGTQFSFTGLGRMTVDQIKSYEGIDIFWGEEAQTFSAHSIETLIPTIRKDGSELWFSWNPRVATDPVDRRFRGPTPPDGVIRRVNYDDNPFFTTALEKERLYDYQFNPARYAHIWLGEYEPSAIGAIWNRLGLHECRVDKPPPLRRIVVAVDPAVADPDDVDVDTRAGAEHGIIVVAEGMDGKGYVLDDFTTEGTPEEWGGVVVAAAKFYETDTIVAEVNQGGAMVASTIKAAAKAVGYQVKVIGVRATKGKIVRAEPISALYPLGRIHHVGSFARLEDQMVQMTNHGYDGAGSPDRVDALVWGLTHLFPRLVMNFAPRKVAAPSSTNRGDWRPRVGMR